MKTGRVLVENSTAVFAPGFQDDVVLMEEGVQEENVYPHSNIAMHLV
jgi:hypothetical protein